MKNKDNSPIRERLLISQKIRSFLAVDAVSSEPVSLTKMQIQGICRENS